MSQLSCKFGMKICTALNIKLVHPCTAVRWAVLALYNSEMGCAFLYSSEVSCSKLVAPALYSSGVGCAYNIQEKAGCACPAQQ